MPNTRNNNNTSVLHRARIYYYVNINPYIVNIWDLTKVYLLLVIAHWIAAVFYYNQCVPKSTMGLILSPLTMATPHCRGMLWFINLSGNAAYYRTQAVAAWLGYNIVQFFQTSRRRRQ